MAATKHKTHSPEIRSVVPIGRLFAATKADHKDISYSGQSSMPFLHSCTSQIVGVEEKLPDDRREESHGVPNVCVVERYDAARRPALHCWDLRWPDLKAILLKGFREGGLQLGPHPRCPGRINLFQEGRIQFSKAHWIGRRQVR